MASSHLRDRELKKGAADLLVLSLLEERSRHGYDLAKRIEEGSGGAIVFHVASLYTLLYRLEARGLVRGRWVERAGERRRRIYQLTPQGRRRLAEERKSFERFAAAVGRIAGIEHA
jgi:transcriptional regulator